MEQNLKTGIRILNLWFKKGIKKDISNARTPQQNGVAERKNRTLIEAKQEPCLQIHFYLKTLFGLSMLVTASYVLNKGIRCHCDNLEYRRPLWRQICLGKSDEGFLVRNPREEEQTFLDDLARLQIQEKEANEEAEALRKNLDQETEILVTQGGAAKSSTEYVAAASCCGQVFMESKSNVDYGFNFMNTKIYIDNESTICIVKNPVYHSKTKHIAIRHHFIRDAYEKKLIQVLKIHTNDNVADLLTKAFDVSDQPRKIELLRRLRSKGSEETYTCRSTIFKEYQKRISKEQRQQRKNSSKKKRVQKESVSKQGRKNAKGDGKAKENAQSKGRTKEMMDEDKETDEVGLSTEDEVSTAKEGVSTDFEKVSTDRPKLSTDDLKVSTDEQMESNDDQVDASEEIFEGTKEQGEGIEEKVESTAEQKESTEEQTKEEIATQASQTPSSMIFGDDETIATLLINMSKAKTASKEKEKGVELKDVEDTERHRPTSTRSTLTLKPLPKINPKDKGKKKIEEEDETESEDDDIPQVVKKFKQLESDEELARKARIEADRILAEKLQEQEREQFTIEERAKFLHDTIAAQRKFLPQQRS
ncbi:putative ribonuclease H-like domain-containing protein [Tanacetum coccineum]